MANVFKFVQKDNSKVSNQNPLAPPANNDLESLFAEVANADVPGDDGGCGGTASSTSCGISTTIKK